MVPGLPSRRRISSEAKTGRMNSEARVLDLARSWSMEINRAAWRSYRCRFLEYTASHEGWVGFYEGGRGTNVT